MSKRDREKLRKAKARKDKKAKAAKAARAEANQSGDSNAPNPDQTADFATNPFGVDSVGRGGGCSPRLPRRSKKG